VELVVERPDACGHGDVLRDAGEVAPVLRRAAEARRESSLEHRVVGRVPNLRRGIGPRAEDEDQPARVERPNDL
jgi:hypothetical protein